MEKTAVGIGLAMLMQVSQAVAAEVHVEVSYDHTSTNVGTGYRGTVHWAYRATILSDGRVVDAWDGRAGNRKGDTGTSELHLGARWRAVNTHELERISENPTYFSIVHVRVSGQSCKATIARPLKPGQSTYVAQNLSSGRMEEFTGLTDANIRCMIY